MPTMVEQQHVDQAARAARAPRSSRSVTMMVRCCRRSSCRCKGASRAVGERSRWPRTGTTRPPCAAASCRPARLPVEREVGVVRSTRRDANGAGGGRCGTTSRSESPARHCRGCRTADSPPSRDDQVVRRFVDQHEQRVAGERADEIRAGDHPGPAGGAQRDTPGRAETRRYRRCTRPTAGRGRSAAAPPDAA